MDAVNLRSHGTLRQAMTWLHTWCGIACGWVLVAVFMTGTLSVFAGPITDWMRAERMVPGSAPVNVESAVQFAQRYIEQNATPTSRLQLKLPDEHDTAMRLALSDADGRLAHQRVDAGTGQLLPAAKRRDTYGGLFFVTMHYQLHADTAGLWLVGFATMGLLVSVISGIIVHKRIFKNFFTLRLLSPRGWLDAHNVSAVLTLPFQVMIGYTGLLILYYVFMPAAIGFHYGLEDGLPAPFDTDTPYFQALKPTGEADPAERVDLTAAPLVDLRPLVLSTRSRCNEPPDRLVVEWPGAAGSRISVYSRPDESSRQRFLRTPRDCHAIFNGSTGQMLSFQERDVTPSSAPLAADEIANNLHRARYGGEIVRWLYFSGGLFGTVMIVTGLLYFTAARRRRHEGELGAVASRVYGVVDAFTIASSAGLAVACVSYLWANRLLSVDFDDRADWEIQVFFVAWAVMLAHALVRPQLKAWTEQLGLAALMCLALPLLNVATDSLLGAAFARRDWSILGVDIVAVMLGAALASIAWYVANIKGRQLLPRQDRVSAPKES